MRDGRPTKYTDDVPALFIQAMKEGKTMAQFASSLNVCEDTIYEWRKVHPMFSECYTEARNHAKGYWEKWLDEQLLNKNANAGLIKMKFVNQFGYVDKKEIKQESTVSVEISEAEERVRKVYQKPE